MNEKKVRKLPNEWHMRQKLRGGRIHKNKKKYNRKDKHKENLTLKNHL